LQAGVPARHTNHQQLTSQRQNDPERLLRALRSVHVPECGIIVKGIPVRLRPIEPLSKALKYLNIYSWDVHRLISYNTTDNCSQLGAMVLISIGGAPAKLSVTNPRSSFIDDVYIHSYFKLLNPRFGTLLEGERILAKKMQDEASERTEIWRCAMVHTYKGRRRCVQHDGTLQSRPIPSIQPNL
jgi:hypothetical protein